MVKKRNFSGKRLRELRRATPLTQDQWGTLLGISRETVSAIENEKPETIRMISAELVAKWFEYSAIYLKKEEKKSFEEYIMQFFGFWR